MMSEKIKLFRDVPLGLKLNRGLKMAENKPTFFLYCEACDFQQEVAAILPRTPFESVDALRKEVHRFHCSVCGAKHVVIKEETKVQSHSGLIF